MIVLRGWLSSATPHKARGSLSFDAWELLAMGWRWREMRIDRGFFDGLSEFFEGRGLPHLVVARLITSINPSVARSAANDWRRIGEHLEAGGFLE